jgi:hypothetical protein
MRKFRPLSTLRVPKIPSRGADKGIEVGEKPDLDLFTTHALKSPFLCEKPSVPLQTGKTRNATAGAVQLRAGNDVSVTGYSTARILFWERGTAWPENYSTWDMAT